MHRRPPGDGEAVAQTVAFIVASSFFLAIFGTLMLATQETPAPDGGGVQDAANRIEAERLADLLTGSSGIGWEEGPDALDRIGFLHADGDRLDDTHLDALRGAAYAADPDNEKLDYEEALEGLGMPDDGTVGFHVRITPVGLRSVLQAADLSDIRTAYVGDWDNLPNTLTVSIDAELGPTNEARAQVDELADPFALQEREVLDSLGLGFDNVTHLLDGILVKVDVGLGETVDLEALVGHAALEGDVYPDDKQYLDAVLADRLDKYEILVIGSTVDHSSLTSNVVKDAVRDWVLDGGTLMVFGSDSQNFQWMQPLFQVGTATVNSAPAAPDVSHPMLHEPHELDWTAYDNHDLGWDLPQQGANAIYDEFQHIITTDGDDVLTVSNEGTFGDGRIFLTTYRPTEVADDVDFQEASNLLHNMVLFSDRAHLYLDYGPTPPDQTAISAAVRTTQILDPELGMVNARVTVLYWGV